METYFMLLIFISPTLIKPPNAMTPVTELKAYSYIRFSSAEQLKGDSLRRQTEATEAYCKEKGYTLDNSLYLQDLGLSAFNGKHRTKGALGEFLQLVEAGQIAKGSLLIVENLDRLSRQEILTALNQFTSIIQSGITVVTLQDKMEYSQASITDNWSQLIISITYMARAHDESLSKSKRLKQAWEQKRLQASNGQHKLTARCPLWLKLSADKTQYIPIPEVCKAVEIIYHMKLQGKSKRSIVQELNQRQDVWQPPVNKRNRTGGWQEPYVQKILTTPAVIGVFQPRQRDGDDRKVPACEPIPDYYPVIIDRELYYEVQALIHRNSEQRGNAGGQTGKANNLFVHIVNCGLCKHPMHYFDKGQGKYAYLHCDYSRRNMDCTAKPIRYDELERVFFDNFEELNISELLPDRDETVIRLNDLRRQLTARRQELLELDNGINNISDTIFKTSDAGVRETLERRLKQAIQDKAKTEGQIKLLTNELTAVESEAKDIQANIDTTKEVYSLLKDAKDMQERINIRLRLRTEIRKIIESVEVYPLQEPYKPIEEIEPGIYRIMNSRHINKVRIRFKGSTNMRVLYLKTTAVKE